MILLPLLIGQSFAARIDGRLDLFAFLCAGLFGLLYQVHLLYTNDHGDEATDRLNTGYWLSGGSRVVPDGVLESEQLLVGARIALALLSAWTVLLALGFERPWMLFACLLAVLLSWAYHRPPLRLSYRGDGEVLQGLGCGVLLPLIGFYLQRATLAGFPWAALLPLYLLFHAGHIVTALPDLRSDQASSKRTLPVRVGEKRARRIVLTLLALCGLSILMAATDLSWTERALVVGPAGVLLAGLALCDLSSRAGTDTLPATRSFVSWVSLSQAWMLCAWIAVLLIGKHT